LSPTANTRSPPKSRPQKRKRRARGSVTSEEILTTAQALIEREGFAGFTMPALAREIGCGVMTIYWYFRSKDALTFTVAERVTAEVHSRLPPIATDVPWHEAYRERLAAFRREFESSRTFVEIFVAQREELYADPAVAALVDQQSRQATDLLVSAGFTAEEARKLHLMCIGFVRGFVLHEHPWVPAVAGSGVDTPAHDRPAASPFDDDLFDFSLDVLLTGMRAKLDARPASKGTSSRSSKRSRR